MGKSKYSEEFRAKAVELVLTKGRSPQQVGEELNVTDKTIKAWVQKHADNHSGEYLRIQELEQELRKVKKELAESQEIVEIQKNGSHPERTLMDTYQTIRGLRRSHTVRLLCRALDVSRAAYYAWLKAKPTKRKTQDQVIRQRILASHAAALCYGVTTSTRMSVPRSSAAETGFDGLCGKWASVPSASAKNKATTNSAHAHPVAPNLLRGLKITAPNQVWVVDITYVPTDEGCNSLLWFLHLAFSHQGIWRKGPHLQFH